MKTQYTPGPWLTPGTDDDAYIISHIDAKGKQRTLAHVYSADNAQLIAAAPDLLAALQALSMQIKAHHKMNVRKDFALMVADVAAENAINKATGGQQ